MVEKLRPYSIVGGLRQVPGLRENWSIFISKILKIFYFENFFFLVSSQSLSFQMILIINLKKDLWTNDGTFFLSWEKRQNVSLFYGQFWPHSGMCGLRGQRYSRQFVTTLIFIIQSKTTKTVNTINSYQIICNNLSVNYFMKFWIHSLVFFK